MADRPANDRDRPKRPSSKHRPRPAGRRPGRGRPPHVGPKDRGRARTGRASTARDRWPRHDGPRHDGPRRDGPRPDRRTGSAYQRDAGYRQDRGPQDRPMPRREWPGHPGPAAPTATTDRAAPIRPAPAIARPVRARQGSTARPTPAVRRVRLARRPRGRDRTSSRATTTASARPSTIGRVATSRIGPPYRPTGDRAAGPATAVPTGSGCRLRPAVPPPAGRPGLPPPDALTADEELVAGRRPVEEAFVARRPARRLLVVPQRRQALEKIVLHATSLRIPIVEVEGGSLTALCRLRWPSGRRPGRRAASLRHHRRRPRPRRRARRAAVRARPRLARGPAQRRFAPSQRRRAGVHGVLFPVRRQAPLTPSAIKASAGAVEHLLLVRSTTSLGARGSPRSRHLGRGCGR